MDFEGTEKKLEILVTPDTPSLRGRGKEFWAGIVAKSNAVILSTISNEHVDAYLLSESSLFVYDGRMIMITCGRTTLVESAEAMLKAVPLDHIQSFIYERKNENFPGMQPSTFDDDAARLAQQVPGTATIFGDRRGHHVSMFHMDREFEPDAEDITLEVLMYGLDPAAAARFAAKDGETIRNATGIHEVLPGFTIDDHAFSPAGYSLNGIRGEAYTTVHVTPEEAGSYASYETSFAFPDNQTIRDAVERVVGIFNPNRFDVFLFQNRITFDSFGPFHMQREACTTLSSGYAVQFCHFLRDAETPAGAGEPASRKARS